MTLYYDDDGDVLDMFIGKPRKAFYREIKDDVFVRIDSKTKKIVGFMVINFRKRFRKTEKAEIPVNFSGVKISKKL